MAELTQEERRRGFLDAIKAVCKEYDISISHEDSQGGFILEDGYDDEDSPWGFDNWFARAVWKEAE